MRRAIVLAGALAAAVALYIVMATYVLPPMLQGASRAPMPEPALTGLTLSASRIALGGNVTITVEAKNAGDTADMQIVSLGFPNLTSSGDIKVLQHDFRQSPIKVDQGDRVGSGYTGRGSVGAQYASVEFFSRPWDGGASYTGQVNVSPKSEGTFVVLVKSVAFPHTWDGAHYPRAGAADYQQEFVEEYSVQVTKG